MCPLSVCSFGTFWYLLAVGTNAVKACWLEVVPTCAQTLYFSGVWTIVGLYAVVAAMGVALLYAVCNASC